MGVAEEVVAAVVPAATAVVGRGAAEEEVAVGAAA
jgi:hypothetical protein